MVKKKKSQKEHSRRRIMQRFDVVLTDHDLGEIVKKIKTQEFRLIFKESNRVYHFKGEINSIPCEIVYDKTRDQVITAWPIGEKPFIY